MVITHVLEQNVKQYGDEVCLVEINPDISETRHLNWREYPLVEPASAPPYRREITWNIFSEKANRFANLLVSRGIRKGDKVGILLMNCLEWLPIYFGVLKTGALAVPLNFRYASDEIAYCVDLADVDVLVFGPEFVTRIEENKAKIADNRLLLYVGPGEAPAFADSYAEVTADCCSTFADQGLSEDDEAAIYFSSGTTGFPKAILHTHRSLSFSCQVEQAHHGQVHEDVFLCIPPLYHTGAKMHWFGSFLVGGKAVLLKGVRPEHVLKTVSDERCTIVWLLVPWALDILAALDAGTLRREDYKLDQWRLMHIGAQPVPQSLVHRWLEYFPDHAYDTNYGLSESIGPGCVHLGVENVHKVGAIGKPGFGWQAKIVDEQGASVAQGSVGELCVKGPGLMRYYYKDPKATAEVLKEGWLFTGDMAREDEDNFIFLVDRKKDVIISGGENIYPVQIEEFLHAHPSIRDVAVIGLSDSRLGEKAVAIVELNEGAQCSEEELATFCRQLPRYKRPRQIIFAKVPRNPTGKIEKPKLRRIYGGEALVAAQSEG